LDKEKQKCDEFQFSHQNIYISNQSKFYFPDRDLTFISCPKVISTRSTHKINNEEKDIIFKLKKIDKSFFQLLEDTKMQYKKQQFESNSIYEFFCRNKIPLLTGGTSGIDKDIYLLFLQILRYRKMCKAEQWYPFVSTISLNSRLFVSRSVGSSDDSSFSCFATSPLGDLQRNGLYGSHQKNQKNCRQISLRDLREDKLSQSFLKNSQSEKQLSQLVTILINK
jgi:hypothetical protein